MHLRTVLCVIGCCSLGAFAAAPPSALNNTDKKFLNIAAGTDMLEAHLGQMAESSASATGVDAPEGEQLRPDLFAGRSAGP